MCGFRKTCLSLNFYNIGENKIQRSWKLKRQLFFQTHKARFLVHGSLRRMQIEMQWPRHRRKPLDVPRKKVWMHWRPIQSAPAWMHLWRRFGWAPIPIRKKSWTLRQMPQNEGWMLCRMWRWSRILLRYNWPKRRQIVLQMCTVEQCQFLWTILNDFINMFTIAFLHFSTGASYLVILTIYTDKRSWATNHVRDAVLLKGCFLLHNKQIYKKLS